VVAVSFVSDGESAVAEEPGDGPFDLPTVSAQAFGGLDPGAGDAWDDAPGAQPGKSFGGVVGLIGAMGWPLVGPGGGRRTSGL